MKNEFKRSHGALKSVITLCLCCICLSLSAQHQVSSFFDEHGVAKLQTETFNPQMDSVITTFHRAEDVIWSRVVYRVIDMRYKQNFQLYFPVRYDDPEYRSLFKVIVDAIIDGMPVYEKRMDQIKPDFTSPMPRTDIPTVFLVGEGADGDSTFYDIQRSDAMLMHYDSLQDQLSFHFYPYTSFVQNQLKYLIQEIIFFDRQTSRLYSKIMAIAPLQADKISPQNGKDINYMQAFRESMLFWIPFDALRPYMKRQFIIPSKNETKRVTFDEFFQKKLYSSYLLGESNVYDRMILDYATTPEEVNQEQERITTELLNFEQNLWEY